MAEKKAEGAKSPKMIKGTTSSGLKFMINPMVKDDLRVLMFINEMNKEGAGAIEKTEAFFDFLGLIFNDQVPAFMNEVAHLHGGVADTKSVYAELKEILNAAGLKKS